MIYAAGLFGFIGGFCVGQMLLYFLLRHKTNEELLNDRYLKLKYGSINWLCAVLGAYGLVNLYRFYFMPL